MSIEDVAPMPLGIRGRAISAELGTLCATRAAMHLIVPVWGVSHVTTFLDVVLPLYLTPENIPAVAGEREVRLRIYTRGCDTGLFVDSATFQRARDRAEIDFVYMDDKIEIPHMTMSWCHKDALRFAADCDAMTILLTADSIFADTTLLRLGHLSDQGKRAVLVAGPRVIEEEMLAELDKHWRKGDQARMTPETFTALCLRHLHPITLSHTWNGTGYLNTHPSHLYWAVENEGFLAHCFHLHPLMVRPRAGEVKFDKTIDDDYMTSAGFTSEEIHIVSDSLDLAAFSITGRHIVIGNDRPLVPSAAYVAFWATSFVQPYQRALARTPICFHTQKTSPAWRCHEDAAQRVLDDIDRLLTDGNFRLFIRRPDLFFDKVLLNHQTLSFHPMRDALRRRLDEPVSASARQWHRALLRILLSKDALLIGSSLLGWLHSGRYVLSLKRAIYPWYIDVVRLYPKIYRFVFGAPPAVRLCHRRWLFFHSYAVALEKAVSSAAGHMAVVSDDAADRSTIEYLNALIQECAGDRSYPTLRMLEDCVTDGALDRYDSIVYIEAKGRDEDRRQNLRGLLRSLRTGGRIHKIAIGGEKYEGLPTVEEDISGLTVEVETRIGGRASKAVLRGLSHASALLRRTGRLEPFCGLAVAPFGALLIPLLNRLAWLIDASGRPPANPLVRYLVLLKG
jgi:hypothetical protein